MNDILELDSIELTLGRRRVLSSVYVCCRLGEIIGLLGRNGSGKSCLMKVAIGLMPAENKSIRMNGIVPGHGCERKWLMAYLPQEHMFPATITIGKAMRLFRADISKIVGAFPEVADYLDEKPGRLSGGYRRLSELLAVLYSPARFCLLDEPFTGLMPLHIEMLKSILSDIAKRKGIILTDHMYRHVTSVAHRTYLLSDGSTFEVKTNEDLLRRGYLNGH